MSMVETLGVLAHRGGLVVARPELSVGVIHAISRPTGLELELLARRPLDRRSASQRQADIRAARTVSSMAPRRLLPPFDEGIDLRVGWLDPDGRAHWEFGSWSSSSSGDDVEGTHGPSVRTALGFPPLFDQVSVVLAWPEIGFAETVVDLSLPDRATVERDTVSIWDAPLHTRPIPGFLHHRLGAFAPEELAVEAGRIVAPPRVLNRGQDAAVVLTRLTAVSQALSMEILSLADGRQAQAMIAAAFPPSHRPPGIPDDPEHLRTRGPGASIAVVHEHDAIWAEPHARSSTRGATTFRSKAEYVVSRPDSGTLALMVAWPAAELADVCVEIPLREHRSDPDR